MGWNGRDLSVRSYSPCGCWLNSLPALSAQLTHRVLHDPHHHHHHLHLGLGVEGELVVTGVAASHHPAQSVSESVIEPSEKWGEVRSGWAGVCRRPMAALFDFLIKSHYFPQVLTTNSSPVSRQLRPVTLATTGWPKSQQKSHFLSPIIRVSQVSSEQS